MCLWLFSDKLLKMSVFLPHISQKEESVEQPEFRYDEFGFRVDKEGKTSPIPPTCVVFSPSHAFKCGRILQPFCAKSCLPTYFCILPFVINSEHRLRSDHFHHLMLCHGEEGENLRSYHFHQQLYVGEGQLSPFTVGSPLCSVAL